MNVKGVYMDIISARDLNKEQIEDILKSAEKMEKKIGTPMESGNVVATLFFEPSTRTKLSFQTAASRLGMKYIDFHTEFSSLKKGESFTDTIKNIDGYVDIIIMRHPKEGAARLAAEVAESPVVNGGDGGNQHPTQALLDLYTIKKTKGKIAGVNFNLVGDLKHARTMHSLLYFLSMFKANVKLISPKGLELDPELIDEVKEKFNAKVEISNELSVEGADVLYACRIQAERFADPYEAKRVQKEFSITAEHLKGAKDDLVIMHPLPKVKEIALEIDHTPYAKYFEQAWNGIPTRMAVLDYVLKH
ncbi:aspartate carbamoyltransferase [Candidatus Micrarchaeota archaeon]|nr:aspartate carbamoyltransferase [Candidatus Micrarchaeota archaeon]